MRDPRDPQTCGVPAKPETEHLRESHHQYGPVDLRTCDEEPIHVPGAIQPHGVLLALYEPELEVAVASANAAEMLGASGSITGRSLSRILGDDGTRAVREALAEPGDTTVPLRLEAGGRAWDGIPHRSDGLMVLELEPADEAPPARFVDFYRRVRHAVARMQKSERVLELSRVTANEVRALTGFDRVMVYRFDADGAGEVIAEARRQELESFLGLHYPAADIPRQARRLYRLNWLRLIATTDYRPVALDPVENPLTGKPLDLTHSLLRSVSPIHLEYLRNMGVGASMSISLLDGEELWGLIACHHYEPRFVPYEVRSSCEFLGQALSWQIAARERTEQAQHVATANAFRERLLRQLSIHENLDAALTRDEDSLLGVARATGAAICIDDGCRTVGVTPEWKTVERVAQALRPLVGNDGVFATDRLREVAPDLVGELSAGGEEAGLAGVLLIVLDESQRDMVVWFRDERLRTMRWGHDGAHAGFRRRDGERLSPLGSFREWQETVRGRSLPWTDWEIDSARSLRTALMETLVQRAAELQQLNQELRHAAEAKDEFLATVSHELRNPMQAILGWSRLLATSELPDDRRGYALEVVQRNAEMQSQLIDDLLDISRLVSGKLRLEIRPCDLGGVVQAAIDTVSSAAEARSITVVKRVDSSAVDIQGDPDRLQQVVWNLLSNAIKFTPKGGRVDVRVERVGSSARISVSDDGEGIEPALLPHIFERFQQGKRSGGGGLGLGLSIVRGLTEMHGGTVEAFSDGPGKGSRFEIVLPLATVRRGEPERERERVARADEAVCPDLAGVRVLVVDDEPDATVLLSEILTSCGAVVLTANSAAQALEVLEAERVDVLLSDIGMPEMDGYALLREIRRRTPEGETPVPAAALTAYGRSQDRARAFRAGFQTHLSKPVEPIEVQTVVASLSGRVS